MSEKATHEDAHLILRLYELRREAELRQARAWLAKTRFTTFEDFISEYPAGSEGERYFRMVTTYWDMVASFITSGVLNLDLFAESGNELLFTWEKIKALVPGWRAAFHSGVISNTERVAHLLSERMERREAGAYEKFSARVAAIGARSAERPGAR